MDNINLKKQKNEEFIMLACEFLGNFVREGKKWLDTYERQGIEAGKINGQIAFWLRDWFNFVDAIAVLFANANIFGAQVLTRSAWEVYLQFKYFLDDKDEQVVAEKLKCYLLVMKYKKILMLQKNLDGYIKQNNIVEAEKIKADIERAKEGFKSKLFDGCIEYRKRIENKPQLNWYTVYDKNIKSIRGLAKKVMAVNEQSIENINENIYGLLSAYAHGLFSGDGFYFGEDKKMKFLPFRYNNGGSFSLLMILIMFDDILLTLKDYYGDKIDFERILTPDIVSKQKDLLVRIRDIDEVLQGKV